MRAPLVRQGEGPAAAFERARRARQDDLALQRRVSMEVGVAAPEPGRRVLARGLGDLEALRGIPAIGRGVQGAIRDTRP